MTARFLDQLLDERVARTPDAPALVAGPIEWTYADLAARTHRLAAWLTGLGVQRGDRVLIAAPHSPYTVALLSAVSRVGAIYVVISDRIRPYHLEHIVADSEPALVVADPGIEAPVPSGRRHDLEEVARVGDGPDVPAWSAVSRSATDVVSLIYTSGSTAMPKAVVSTHQQVLYATQAIADCLGYRQDDRLFCCLPLSFDYGLYQVFLSIEAGACLVLGDAGDAGPGLFSALEKHAVTVLPLVPGVATSLNRLAKRARRLPATLRMVTNTGAALSPAASAQLRTWAPDLQVVPMYGLTECKRVSIETPNADIERPGSVGRPLPGTEVFVLGDDGTRLPPGDIGQLAVRGPNVMAGYWRAPELTDKRFRRDEFGQATLLTGDRGWMDEDGHIYFAGRDDDIYKQGGFRVSAIEVEGAATDITGVEEAAVLLPKADRAAVLAVVSTLDDHVIRRELALRLEDFKVPDEIRLVAELPHGVNGKIDKRALEAAL